MKFLPEAEPQALVPLVHFSPEYAKNMLGKAWVWEKGFASNASQGTLGSQRYVCGILEEKGKGGLWEISSHLRQSVLPRFLPPLSRPAEEK